MPDDVHRRGGDRVRGGVLAAGGSRRQSAPGHRRLPERRHPAAGDRRRRPAGAGGAGDRRPGRLPRPDRRAARQPGRRRLAALLPALELRHELGDAGRAARRRHRPRPVLAGQPGERRAGRGAAAGPPAPYRGRREPADADRRRHAGDRGADRVPRVPVLLAMEGGGTVEDDSCAHDEEEKPTTPLEVLAERLGPVSTQLVAQINAGREPGLPQYDLHFEDDLVEHLRDLETRGPEGAGQRRLRRAERPAALSSTRCAAGESRGRRRRARTRRRTWRRPICRPRSRRSATTSAAAPTTPT